MPLLWDISRQIRVELSLPALRSENKLAQTVGRGFPDAVLEDFISVLHRPDMHYESIIGYLETNHLRNARSPDPDQPYLGLAAWLTEVIYDKIYNIHVQKSRNPDATVEYLDGLKKLTSKNLPLWVFSLNHDVVLESAAARLGLAVNSGFPGSASLPLPSPFAGETSIKVEVVTEEEMSHGLRFLQSGNEGINLIKLHGGIDIFTLRDGKDVLKLLPVGDHASAMIHALFLANKVLPYRSPNNVNVINTIMYTDVFGEVQFLNRSILSGVFKYNKRMHQVLPVNFLGVFQTMLNHVSKLLCCGYGFGDTHINNVLRQWLEYSADRNIEIIDPKRCKEVPPDFLHLAPQIALRPMKVGAYLRGM